MWTEIKKLLATALWPVIKDVLKKAVRELLDWLIEKAKEAVARRSTANATVASVKAQAAEEMARNAATQAEADLHAAIAKVWREVAEMLRQENEGLKQELDELRAQTSVKTESALAVLTFDQAIDAQSETVKAVEGKPLLQLDGHRGE